MNKKKILLAILVIIIIAVLFWAGSFIRQRQRLPRELDPELMADFLERQMLSEELDPLKEFSGSSVVTGQFIEIDREHDLLNIQTYNHDLREDIILTAKITDDTIFVKKIAQDEKEKLYTKEEFYSDFLSDAGRGFHLRVTVDDIEKELPEAFVVELVDLEVFKYIPFEPENL